MNVDVIEEDDPMDKWMSIYYNDNLEERKNVITHGMKGKDASI